MCVIRNFKRDCKQHVNQGTGASQFNPDKNIVKLFAYFMLILVIMNISNKQKIQLISRCSVRC